VSDNIVSHVMGTDLSTDAGAIANTALLGQPTINLLAELVIATALNQGRSSLPKNVPTGLLFGADREEVLASDGVRAQSNDDGWTINGEATLVGPNDAETYRLLVATPENGGGLLIELDVPTTTFDDQAIHRSASLAVLDPSTMNEVRHAFDVGAIAVLVGLADFLRTPITLTVGELTLDQPDRWRGQSLKHRLANLTLRRDIAWLELSRTLDGVSERERDLHAAIGLHEGLLAATSSLEEFSTLYRAHSDADAALIVATCARQISLLDWLVGGTYRLKDRVCTLTIGM
jgi:hypothetical protein